VTDAKTYCDGLNAKDEFLLALVKTDGSQFANHIESKILSIGLPKLFCITKFLNF